MKFLLLVALFSVVCCATAENRNQPDNAPPKLVAAGPVNNEKAPPVVPAAPIKQVAETDKNTPVAEKKEAAPIAEKKEVPAPIAEKKEAAPIAEIKVGEEAAPPNPKADEKKANHVPFFFIPEETPAPDEEPWTDATVQDISDERPVPVHTN